MHRRAWAIDLLRVLLCFAVFTLFSGTATAQTVNTFVNPTNGTINGATTCAAPLVRNFSVGTSFTVSDVDLGVFATHSWRGDIRLTLESPAGTTVQLVNGDTNSVSGDNFNVRLNDSGTQTVNTDGNTVNHSTTAPPPFANDFIPNNSLSAFNGENSLGTWRLEICDLFPTQDNGTFQHAELYLTEQPANFADLSVNKTVSNTTPANATNVTYTISVTNAAGSTENATGVLVQDILPLGVSFVSASGFGSYNSGTGIWTVGSVPIGQTRTLNIVANVTATSGASVINTAEVIASSALDPDSTPNNGSIGEDDYDDATLTVSGTRVAGTPPNLGSICSIANQILFDWDTVSWTAGSLNNSYNLTGIGTINWSVSSPGVFVNDPAFGGQSPSLGNANNGGFAGTQLSLHQFLDFANQSQTATTVLTLPTAVPGMQFTVFDVDFAANDFADKLTVIGSYNGATVTPTLTNGVANYVVGNVAIGDAGSGGTSGDGNVVVTFLSPVDTITIIYGNHTTAPPVPDGQAIAIHDISFCAPQTALSVTKISSVISDPVNGTTNPKSIPGATVQYCILISNAGSATASSISATDTIPGNLTYTPASMQSGSNCGSASTAEDDDNVGADESDPFGASISGSVVTATAASLGPAEGFALTFQVTLD
ncbi:proprotein convertase P-domain-containing protein [Parasphingorhabdus litoris]|uniref:proprotein convertase P-domain-containing protein n=1 Tax=Parasphingorhabdus litoris TaxID=394733 RepID=UPI001E56A3BB|nr:proprotein convertase P-domain-containing protein [Parasphingorhabdus litoris]